MRFLFALSVYTFFFGNISDKENHVAPDILITYCLINDKICIISIINVGTRILHAIITLIHTE